MQVLVQNHSKRWCALTLTTCGLLVTAVERTSRSALHIRWADCYAVTQPKEDTPSFVLHTQRNKEKLKWARKDVLFNCGTLEECVQCLAHLRPLVAGYLPTRRDDGTYALATVPRRHVLVFINPFGGSKKALQTWQKVSLPMLNASHVTCETVLTSHQGHAREHAEQRLAVGQYDAIVSVSGDGLLHEIVNGLMARPDWAQVIQIPLALIPCGSGNAMARSLQLLDPLAATLAVIKGHSRPLDLMSYRQEDQPPVYGHLEFFWGLLADADIESDKYRFAGPMRFTFSGIGRMLNLRKYRARLTFLPWEPTMSTETRTADARAPVFYPDGSVYNGPPPGWHTMEGEFVTVNGLNSGWQGTDLFLGPYADIADGAIDLMWMYGEDATSAKLLGLMSKGHTGSHVYLPFVHYAKVRAFTLEPMEPRGIMDIDGEPYPNALIRVEMLPSLARILAPPDLELPEFSLKEYMETHHRKLPGTVSEAAAAAEASTEASLQAATTQHHEEQERSRAAGTPTSELPATGSANEGSEAAAGQDRPPSTGDISVPEDSTTTDPSAGQEDI